MKLLLLLLLLPSAAFADVLPDGTQLILERDRLLFSKDGKATPLNGLPEFSVAGGGLLDIELHPDFSTNRFVYLSYVVDENGTRLRVSRSRLSSTGLDAPDIVFAGVPFTGKKSGANGRIDGRLKFGSDRKLYLAHGDFGDKKASGDVSLLLGKTLRLNDDGSVPTDNPMIGKVQGARSEIFRAGEAPFHDAPLSQNTDSTR